MKKIYLRQQQLDEVVEIMRQFELAKNGIKKNGYAISNMQSIQQIILVYGKIIGRKIIHLVIFLQKHIFAHLVLPNVIIL